jgi:YD repeat-containing protein
VGVKIDLADVCKPKLGDPIYPLTGSRAQDVNLDIEIGGEPLTLTYDTLVQVPDASGNLTWVIAPLPSFGRLWQSSLNKSVALQGGIAAGAAYSSAALQRGGDRLETSNVAGFDSCTGGGGGSGSGGASVAYTPSSHLNEQLTFTGMGSSGMLVDGAVLTEELYDANGNATSVVKASGGALTYSYAAGLLGSVSDAFGRSVQFGYEQPSSGAPSRVNQITAPDGSIINVAYDTLGNLSTLTWSDANVRTFVYENWTFPWALTGIVDEMGQRYGTYGYDSQGRATSTLLGAGVDKYQVSYNSAPSWSFSEYFVASSNLLCREYKMVPPTGTQALIPNGQSSNFVAGTSHGTNFLAGSDQPAGSGCSASSSAQTYDVNANLTSHDDFNGNRSCYAYDLSRNLRTVALEGLPGGASGKTCPSNLATYTPSPVDASHPERKTTTVWHPDWVLKAQEAAPKKITTWVYNGQPDPIAGTTAGCVTPATTLPDGKPLAVLCARYEQATTDSTGALGLTATVSGATRAWTYTYNQYGQALTETTPKQSSTDMLSHTTTYVYYTTTSFTGSVGHTMGDLNTVTNPLGQVTTFISYDKAGRLLSSKDANGTVTSMSYFPRGWLQTQTVTPASGTTLTTTYAYWPTGRLQTVTMPDASTLNYTYDTAHRLTDVVDSAGNRVHYALDNSGNRTSEQVSDISGNLAGSVARVFDLLNRVQSTTGAMH